MRRFSFLVALTAASIPGSAFAMSVSWEGSTAVMVQNQPFLTDWLVAYSFRNDMAFAGRYMRTVMTEGSAMKIYAPQFDWLVHRWNARDFQANIYADGAFGAETFENRTSTAGMATLEADIESRLLYAAGKAQAAWVGAGPNFYSTEVRLGVAPYAAEYDEIASWLIVSVQNNPQFVRTVAVTPMARFFYKAFLAEVGSSFEGDWMINFMIHY